MPAENQQGPQIEGHVPALDGVRGPHTVTFEDGPTSPIQDQGTYSVPFNTAGAFKYHCKVHGTPMAGAVTVE